MKHGEQVKVTKTAGSSAIYVPTTTVRVTTAKPEQQPPALELVTPPTGNNGARENSSHHEEGSCLIFLILMRDHVFSENFQCLFLHFDIFLWYIHLDQHAFPCS